MMDINELKIFRAVAHKGSISRAAEELHYVQSNVTARIRQLEERLGTALFHRKSKGVALTAAGHLLLDYAERIIRLVREAEEALSDQGEPKGRLVIGSMETTTAVRLPPLLLRSRQSPLRPQIAPATSSLVTLAQEAARRGWSKADFKLRAVITNAEPLYGYQREVITRAVQANAAR